MVEKRKTCTRGKAKQPCRKIKKYEKDLDDDIDLYDQDNKEDEEVEEVLVTMSILDD
jgi:hypothetical protein